MSQIWQNVATRLEEKKNTLSYGIYFGHLSLNILVRLLLSCQLYL